MDVGIPPVAGLSGFQRINGENDSTGIDRELSLLDGRSQPPGSLQYYFQSATLEPGTSREKVFRGHAHSGGSWSDCRSGAFFGRRSDFFALELHYLDANRGGGGISDGVHVALLQFQGH